jgi:undecaprenyl-diphosphatase
VVLRYGLIALSFLLGAVVHFGYLDSFEIQIIAPIQQAILNANVMWLFQAYAHIGDSIVWIGVALLMMAFYFKRERKALKFTLFITVVAVLTVILRLIFPRPRPFQAYPLLVKSLAYEGLPSYPSGHVAPAAGGFYLLANHSKTLNIIFGAMVVLLAFSRVATGTHYFTDVIGSALFSYPVAAIIDDMKFFERFKEN